MELIILCGAIGSIFFNIVLVKFSEQISHHRTRILMIAGVISLGNWIILITGPFSLILFYASIGSFLTTMINFCFLSLLVDCTPLQHRNLIFQLYAVISTAGTIIANGIGIQLNTAFGASTLFLIIAAVILTMLPVILSINAPKFKQIFFPTS